MKSTYAIPVADTGHPLSYETDRQLANQARSEFLDEGLDYLCQSIGSALKKTIEAVTGDSGSPLKRL